MDCSVAQWHTPFLRTKPSTTGVTLAITWPMSITSADPFPAANLEQRTFSRTHMLLDSNGHSYAFNTPVLAI